jgi:hypothetical protein
MPAPPSLLTLVPNTANSGAELKFHKLLIFAPDSVQSAKNAILAQGYSGNWGFFHIVFHRVVENRQRILETNMRIVSCGCEDRIALLYLPVGSRLRVR